MDKPQFVYVTYISTTPEKVWNALMDQELTRQYWGQYKNVSDWKKGSKWTHQDYDTGEARVVGEVLESDPPRKLVLTWGSTDPAFQTEKPSKVTFQIEPAFGAVRLTVTHEDLDAKMHRAISGGWPAILSSLKTLLETGKPMEMTTRKWRGEG